jgi:putative DNA primase/helicase
MGLPPKAPQPEAPQPEAPFIKSPVPPKLAEVLDSLVFIWQDREDARVADEVAGLAWQSPTDPRLKAQVKGKDVVVAAHTTNEGIRWASGIAGRCSDAKAVRVRIWPVPDFNTALPTMAAWCRRYDLVNVLALAHKARFVEFVQLTALEKQEDGNTGPNLTELGNARRLVANFGHELRFSKPLDSWFEWDGTRWRPDRSGAIWQRAKDTVRLLGHEAANELDDHKRPSILRWALKSENRKIIAAMIDLAWSELGIAILPEQFDVDPWLLNTPSGTVDLKTGELRSHRQDDLISKATSVPFDPHETCPGWQKALAEIFPDEETRKYVQRALGYSLCGVIGEHALFLCYGTGRNGKNTVLDTVRALLGDYGTVTSPRTFLTIGQNDHPTALADLHGKRFVPTDEVEHGERLAESVVKRVTGNQTITARFMRKDFFEFAVQFKVWMICNHKPEIQGDDEGVWSRIRVIPFETYIPPENRIKDLARIVVADEGPGILRWLINGCLEWQRIGLAEPSKVANAIASYRVEQNTIAAFLGECCNSFLDHPTLRTQARESATKLYERYVSWCKDSGEKTVLTKREFSAKLTPLGYELKQSNSNYYRNGLSLKP